MDSTVPLRKLNPGQVFAGKYKLMEKIGAGSFGCVFRTQNLKNGELVAAKFEKREDASRGVSLLIREIRVLTEVSSLKGFPSLRFYGRDEHHNFFMESYLGTNLENLMKRQDSKHYSYQTTLTIGLQICDRLEGIQIFNKALHDKNLIHRDIKPENFTIGRIDPGTIYAIDFGLAKFYSDSHGKHISFTNKKGLIGTARYASIGALSGYEQSRRDDIEALAYMLIYFFIGELPWQNIPAQSREEKYKIILKMKQEAKFQDELIPSEFLKILEYSKKLEFTEQPNYSYIRELLKGNHLGQVLDWEQIQVEKNLSVSIDLQDDERPQSIRKQQDSKIISGQLENSNVLQIPKCSIVLSDAGSPVGTLNSIATSKANNYANSNNMVSNKQFQQIKYQSCTNIAGQAEDDFDVDLDDDNPSLKFQNLVVTRQHSKS